MCFCALLHTDTHWYDTPAIKKKRERAKKSNSTPIHRIIATNISGRCASTVYTVINTTIKFDQNWWTELSSLDTSRKKVKTKRIRLTGQYALILYHRMNQEDPNKKKAALSDKKRADGETGQLGRHPAYKPVDSRNRNRRKKPSLHRVIKRQRKHTVVLQACCTFRIDDK